jgi:hypothetical protein
MAATMACPSLLLWEAFFRLTTRWPEAFKVVWQIQKIFAP